MIECRFVYLSNPILAQSEFYSRSYSRSIFGPEIVYCVLQIWISQNVVLLCVQRMQTKHDVDYSQIQFNAYSETRQKRNVVFVTDFLTGSYSLKHACP